MSDDSKNIFIPILQGIKTAVDIVGQHYGIILNSSKSTVLSIIDKSSKSGKLWYIRFDHAHQNVPYDHININSMITHVKDPHIPLPAGTVDFIGIVGKFFKFISDNITIICITFGAFKLLYALYKDIKGKSLLNFFKTIGAIIGGFIGGYAGAYVGCMIGSLILPGVGTILVGSICAIVGAVYVSNKFESLMEKFYYYVENKIPKCIRSKLEKVADILEKNIIQPVETVFDECKQGVLSFVNSVVNTVKEIIDQFIKSISNMIKFLWIF